MITIVPYSDAAHRGQVVALWEAVFGYEQEHNRPTIAIDKKIEAGDRLFFVALSGASVVGTIMAGYDGHRGWIYSLAVSPTHRRQGIGTRLVTFAEEALTARGCVKINLQILEGNEKIISFYAALGFTVEKRVSMGKRIPGNVPPPEL
jgi:ribosomal protein S18 acetylase RimI-like enzyme